METLKDSPSGTHVQCKQLPSSSQSPLQQPQEGSLDQSSRSSAMAQLTPASSRKRTSPAEQADSERNEIKSMKRQRTLTPIRSVSPPEPPFQMPGKDKALTPAPSVPSPAMISLKLTIPHQELTDREQSMINRHKSDAVRWKPKLQRPYPLYSEIKRAYQLKLMRHYPDASVPAEPNFRKPKIEKSLRVIRLLENCPLMYDPTRQVKSLPAHEAEGGSEDGPKQLHKRTKDFENAISLHADLQANIGITTTDFMKNLAHECFSLRGPRC